METEKSRKIVKTFGVITAVVAFIASAITVTKFVSGKDNLSDVIASVNEKIIASNTLSVGDTIRFGGLRTFKWKVLDVREDRALIISKKIMFELPYHFEYGSVSWETCDLRAYLNGDFYSIFFSAKK